MYVFFLRFQLLFVSFVCCVFRVSLMLRFLLLIRRLRVGVLLVCLVINIRRVCVFFVFELSVSLWFLDVFRVPSACMDMLLCLHCFRVVVSIVFMCCCWCGRAYRVFVVVPRVY